MYGEKKVKETKGEQTGQEKKGKKLCKYSRNVGEKKRRTWERKRRDD